MFSNRKLLIVIFFLLPIIAIFLLAFWLDNDTFFVLAEGRYLAEQGIHYVDVLSMHDNLKIVVQNYGFALIFYWVFHFFGFVGLFLMMIIFNFLICLFIYKISMILSRKNLSLSLLIMLLVDVLLIFSGFVVTRAQMVSYVLMLALIYVLELYVKSNNTKYLWWIPILSLLQINFHASLWWILFLVMLVYIIDSFKISKLHSRGYKTKPLLIALIVFVIFGFINPYGVGAMSYVFTSYNAGSIKEIVGEMSPFYLMDLSTIVVYFIILSILSILILTKKSIKIRHLLLFLGFLTLGLNSLRGIAQLILVMFLPLAVLFKNIKINNFLYSLKIKRYLLSWIITIEVAIIIPIVSVVLPQINGPDESLIAAVDTVDNTNKKRKEDLKVYTGYNDGGYLEYRGYKVYLDQRAEVFLRINNKKEDILEEWKNYYFGRIDKNVFLEKYRFDYLVVGSEEDPFYNLKNDRCNVIYEDAINAVEVFKCEW